MQGKEGGGNPFFLLTNTIIIIKVFIEVKQVLPMAQEHYQALAGKEITERTLARSEKIDPIPVVIRDDARDAVHVAVEAFARLDENLIIDAISSCCHLKFRPQVFLTGIHAKSAHPTRPGITVHHTELYQILNIDKRYIDTTCIREDFVAPDLLYVSPSHRALLQGPSLDPDKAAAGKSYAKKRVKRVDPVTVIDTDLDDWAHEMHHYNSACPGNPLASPSHPINVYNKIRAGLVQVDCDHEHNSELPEGERAHIAKEGTRLFNYPYQFMEENEYALRMADEARPFALRNQVIQENYDIAMAEYKMLSAAEKKRRGPPAIPRLCDTTADPNPTRTRKSAILGRLQPKNVSTYELVKSTANLNRELGGYRNNQCQAVALGQPRLFAPWQKNDTAATVLARSKAHAIAMEEQRIREEQMDETHQAAAAAAAQFEEVVDNRSRDKRPRAALVEDDDDDAARDGFEDAGAGPRPPRQIRISGPTQSASRANAVRGAAMTRLLMESVSAGAHDDNEDDDEYEN